MNEQIPAAQLRITLLPYRRCEITASLFTWTTSRACGDYWAEHGEPRTDLMQATGNKLHGGHTSFFFETHLGVGALLWAFRSRHLLAIALVSACLNPSRGFSALFKIL